MVEYAGIDRHVWAWAIGGVFAYVALIIACVHIALHMKYNSSQMFKYEVRILFMVVVYCLCGWWGLYQKQYTEYYDLLRETYEAIVVYSFYRFLVVYIGGEEKLRDHLQAKHDKKERAKAHWSQAHSKETEMKENPKTNGEVPKEETNTEETNTEETNEPKKEEVPDKEWMHFGSHLGVFRFLLSDWHLTQKFAYYTKLGILQYVPVRLLWAFIGFILEHTHHFEKGVWSPKVGFPYYIITVNISQVWAVYNLLVFYHTMFEEIKGIKPLGKFLSIKLMVFCVFWQQLFLNACVRFRAIEETDTYSVTQVADSLQDFLICIEMFILAISHLTIWPAKEFYMTDHHMPIDRSHIHRLGSVLYPGDMFKDMASAFKKSTRNVQPNTAIVSANVTLQPLPEPSKGAGEHESPTTTNGGGEKTVEITDQESLPVDEPLDADEETH